jgi:hypothetical protein
MRLVFVLADWLALIKVFEKKLGTKNYQVFSYQLRPCSFPSKPMLSSSRWSFPTQACCLGWLHLVLWWRCRRGRALAQP